jgi:xylan 1,4-beta-xylosidase
LALDAIVASGVKGSADVGVLASRGERTITAMLWNYHDDDLPASPAAIDLTIEGTPKRRVLMHHYRIDAGHSNSYEEWKRMGSPQSPSAEQYRRLERAGQLELLGSPEWVSTDGSLRRQFELPRQAVTLIRLSW